MSKILLRRFVNSVCNMCATFCCTSSTSCFLQKLEICVISTELSQVVCPFRCNALEEPVREEIMCSVRWWRPLLHVILVSCMFPKHF
uniref:Uncharacterized protein n=1 Tax=Rhipicephalus pulchellus TaxID=72859 RepID=L7LW08_RHIPC